MTELQRLSQLFSSGKLVRPGTGTTFVDVVQALLKLSGGQRVKQTGTVETLCRLIGPSEHYVLILVDGLGQRMLERHCPEGFLAANRKATLSSVFPSTTAAALTTLATGAWPARHAALGWWLRLTKQNRSIVTLPFVERGTGTAMEQLNVTIEQALPLRPVWGRLRRDVCSVVPHELIGSAYSTYASGGTTRIGYDRLTSGIRRVVSRVRSQLTPSLTYLYLPHLDSLMHGEGPSAGRTAILLRELDTLLGDMTAHISGQARVLITADHGQLDIPPGRTYCLPENDPLAACLVCQPTGEPRVPFFHVTHGREEEFRKRFCARFAEDFALLSPADMQRLHLFGPGPLGRVSLPRLGTYAGIPLRNAKFHVQPAGDSVHQRGAHGGLSPEEMLVPLVVA